MDGKVWFPEEDVNGVNAGRNGLSDMVVIFVDIIVYKWNGVGFKNWVLPHITVYSCKFCGNHDFLDIFIWWKGFNHAPCDCIDILVWVPSVPEGGKMWNCGKRQCVLMQKSGCEAGMIQKII